MAWDSVTLYMDDDADADALPFFYSSKETQEVHVFEYSVKYQLREGWCWLLFLCRTAGPEHVTSLSGPNM